MRHRKHNHQLGVKTAHRTSMLANLCCSLIENGRIKTTLARARALRPTIEKIITLAKKAHFAQDTAKKYTSEGWLSPGYGVRVQRKNCLTN